MANCRPGRFITSRNGIIVDTLTGLTWEEGPGQSMEWEAAVYHCNKLRINDIDGWRLPTRFELESLLDISTSSPACDGVFDAKRGVYWSATPYANSPNMAWAVDFEDGYVTSEFKDSKLRVRAVHGIKWADAAQDLRRERDEAIRSDCTKTREINILVRENRLQAEALRKIRSETQMMIVESNAMSALKILQQIVDNALTPNAAIKPSE